MLRDPSLRGRPLAVQQHQDIISVTHDARSAGVRKHMAPAQVGASCKLQMVQGTKHMAQCGWDCRGRDGHGRALAAAVATQAIFYI